MPFSVTEPFFLWQIK